MGKEIEMVNTFISVLMLVMTVSLAEAVEPSEMLSDPVLEQRAREISKGLRCLVCQNQSIDESNAGLARDLRVLVRERLSIGDSDQEVIDYIVYRYGDFVLLNPPFKLSTLALWLGPLGIAGAAGLIFFNFFRRRSNESETTIALSKEEDARFKDIFGKI